MYRQKINLTGVKPSQPFDWADTIVLDDKTRTAPFQMYKLPSLSKVALQLGAHAIGMFGLSEIIGEEEPEYPPDNARLPVLLKLRK